MYNRKLSNLLPRINSKVIMKNNPHKSNDKLPKDNENINQQEKISAVRKSREKKPGTSINTKKPIYILPEIPIKKLAKTANIKTNNTNNNINNNINSNNENINYYRQNDVQNNERYNKEEDYHIQYENISLFMLENDEELKNMFNKIKINGWISDKKKWIEENLLKREVFWTMLEYYVKKNLDVNRFIRKKINKILKNKILDNVLAKSLKMIQFQYNEYINNINNL